MINAHTRNSGPPCAVLGHLVAPLRFASVGASMLGAHPWYAGSPAAALSYLLAPLIFTSVLSPVLGAHSRNSCTPGTFSSCIIAPFELASVAATMFLAHARNSSATSTVLGGLLASLGFASVSSSVSLAHTWDARPLGAFTCLVLAPGLFANKFARATKVCIFGAFEVCPARAYGAFHVCMNRAQLSENSFASTPIFNALMRTLFLGGGFLIATRGRGDNFSILDLQYLRIHILYVGEWTLFGARWMVIVCGMLIIIF